MSTTSNTDTTEKWQSNSAKNLSHGTVMLISSHWTEVTQHLALPGAVWAWSECGLSHRVKMVLKDRDGGLIRRAPNGEKWVTSMRLWCYVIDRAADNETIGAEARGQEMLDIPADTSSTTRFLTDTTTTVPLSRERQSTLTGGVAHTDTEEIRKPWLKDPTWSEKTPREKAAQHPAQVRLAAWEDGSTTDSWDVDTTGSQRQLSQPEGRVYYPTASSTSTDGQATLTAFTRQWRVTVPA